MTGTDKIFFTRLVKKDKKLFMEHLRSRLTKQRRLSLAIEKRASSPRVRSVTLTNKLLRRYERATEAAGMLLDILGGAQNG